MQAYHIWRPWGVGDITHPTYFSPEHAGNARTDNANRASSRPRIQMTEEIAPDINNHILASDISHWRPNRTPSTTDTRMADTPEAALASPPMGGSQMDGHRAMAVLGIYVQMAD